MKSNRLILKDPIVLWTVTFKRDKKEYSMISFIKEMKSKYGLQWIGFYRIRVDKPMSEYKIINDKLFDYFLLKYPNEIEEYVEY